MCIRDRDTLEAALAEPDPLAALKRKHADPDLGRSRAALHAEAQAAAVLGAWLEHGPGPALDQAIDQATDTTQLGDRTIYYDAKNDITVVQSDTTGKIMSVRRGAP